MSDFTSPPIGDRLRRHVELSRQALGRPDGATPPLLVLFVNSICNLTCEHCFYWRSLNQRDDLSYEELERLSADLDPIENLNLSGGEPFLRKDVDRVVRLFVRNNRHARSTARPAATSPTAPSPRSRRSSRSRA